MGSQLSLTNSQGRSAAQREYITLNKTRNEGFGMQLGWKLFVQGMSEYGVASNQGLQKGDTIVKVSKQIQNIHKCLFFVFQFCQAYSFFSCLTEFPPPIF